MPRPHALPRRKPRRNDPTFPPFRAIPPIRPLASINALRADKALFDAMQSWWSYREGRSIHQWEAFGFLMRVAIAHRDHALLRGFSLPLVPDKEDATP